MHTKNEYRNDSPGAIGVTTFDNGKPKGLAVKPGDTIWLSEEERIATANAPKLDEDNPFTNGTLTLVTPAAEIKNRRDIGADELPAEEKAEEKSEPQSEPPATPEEVQQKAKADQGQADKAAKAEAARRAQAAKQADNPGKPVDETGAAVEPQGLPHQGQRAPQEEVATPAAPAKAGAKG